MKNNIYMFNLQDCELEQVTGGMGQENNKFGWHWGDDWGDQGYWDETGATRE